MELLNREFTAKTVAMAAGTQTRNISDWASRGYFIGHSNGGGVQGKTRHYSFTELMEIVVGVLITDQFGMPPSRTFALSSRFAHFGEEPALWGHADPTSETVRAPGLPFHHNLGTTYIVTYGDSTEVVLSPNGKIDMTAFAPNNYEYATAFIVINVTSVFAQVCQRLGWPDYRNVLDEAYPEEASK